LRDVTCGRLTSWCTVDPALMPGIDCGGAILQRASKTMMRHFRSVCVRSVFVPCAALRIRASAIRASAIRAFAIGTLPVGAFALLPAMPQQSVARAETPAAQDSKHDDLKQNFQKEHELGRRFRIDPADLPAPKTGPIVTNRALIVA